MNEPMIIWYILVIVAVVASSIQLTHYLQSRHETLRRSPVHVLDMNRESDIFFVPGDDTSDEYIDDFEDL